MKKSLLFFNTLFLSLVLCAQSPAKFSYQSTIHNADGSYARNQSIGVMISILKGSATGDVVYTETHQAATNSNGLLILTIGEGVTSQKLTDIDWSNGLFFIKSEYDLSGGTNYQLENTTQLLSVPFAMYAQKSSDSYKVDGLGEILKELQMRVDTIDSITTKVNTVDISEIMDKLVTSIKLEGIWYVNLGQTETLHATPSPFASSQLRWISSDTEVATVENGIVTGNSTGVATITVCSKYDETIKASMDIYVGLPGLFSVSETEKARFLCGNLYNSYIGSSGVTGPTKYYWTQLNGDCVPYNGNRMSSNITDLLGNWVMPRAEQFTYIFEKRPNAQELYGFATVYTSTGTYKGLVILPDDWSALESVSFLPQGNYYSNYYSADDWKKMEEAGAVFLAVAGYGTDGTNPYYNTWHSSEDLALYVCYSDNIGIAPVLSISNGSCNITTHTTQTYLGDGWISVALLCYRLIQIVQ